jgi:hypothetical protein
MSFLKGFLLPIVLVSGLALPEFAQDCPQPDANGADVPSQARTLQGQIIYHDGIRQWFELKLDKPECGRSSIQLTQLGDNWKQLETLRGCRVKTSGTVDSSPTGYYSLDLCQDVRQIQSVGECTKRPPLPAASKAKPDKSVREYRVDMHVNYTPGDHSIVFRVTSAGKGLQPWQAYARYMLTGGFVLYGLCGEGFVVDKVFGTRQASPSHFTESRDGGDMAMFDPEGAASSGTTDLRLSYTCIRLAAR